MIIGVPRGIIIITPKPLRIRGQTAGPGTGDEQVASILEKQLFKSRIKRHRSLDFALVCRLVDLFWRGLAQIEFYPVEYMAKILFVRGL